MSELYTSKPNIVSLLAAFGISLELGALSGLSEKLCQISISNNHHLQNDSRNLRVGDVFCAVIGHHQDGRDYIDSAIAARASVVLAQCQQAQQHGQFRVEGNTVIVDFYQLNTQLFALAKFYYQAPQQALTLVGVTGTNGKTSITQLIAQLHNIVEENALKAHGLAVDVNSHEKRQYAVIGTTGAGIIGKLKPIINTTPGAIELHQLLYDFVHQGVTEVAMEVSSHALVQGRVHGQLFSTAVFSNISHDHLDYHLTMDNYAKAKLSIFTNDDQQMAVINGDDSYAKAYLAKLADNTKVIVYGREHHDQYYRQYVVAKKIKHTAHGLTFDLVTHLGTVKCCSALMGDFNVDNLLAAIAVLISQSVSLTDLANAVLQVRPIAGRMESFTNAELADSQLPVTVVDYAHTPDALKNALQACRSHGKSKIWLVFGCGGERDKDKRPLMGKIAEQFADHVIVTNDNPRSEAPQAIAKQILSGCKYPEKMEVQLDRKKAVKSALSQATNADIVLLAGKGHEQNIVLDDCILPYNEREFVRKMYQAEIRA